MAQQADRLHLDQEELSAESKEKLGTLGKWLSKETTKFEKRTPGRQKCVDPDLPKNLHSLFSTLDFVKTVCLLHIAR